jgi:DNA mismatch repair ATPase MutS
MPVDCTFVKFVENADKPYVKAVDFWNPHVDPTKVVVNSITFGGDKEQNIVVTGINRGGKSTIFGAFITDVLFAQSFGIAFAKEFVMTPFAKIGCYMNTMGDISAGMSTFQAEQHRAKQLCQTIDSFQGKGFTLIFMDELFTGTDPQAGSLATCGFAKRLAQFDNAITVFVTHYKEPIKLEEQVPGKITNYSVGAIEEQDGSFIPTYKLNEGPSYQNDALQMLGDLVII